MSLEPLYAGLCPCQARADVYYEGKPHGDWLNARKAYEPMNVLLTYRASYRTITIASCGLDMLYWTRCTFVIAVAVAIAIAKWLLFDRAYSRCNPQRLFL